MAVKGWYYLGGFILDVRGCRRVVEERVLSTRPRQPLAVLRVFIAGVCCVFFLSFSPSKQVAIWPKKGEPSGFYSGRPEKKE